MSPHLEFLEGSGARLRRWVFASVLIFSAHAAAGALAFVSWQEEDSLEEDSGVFLVEFAPAPAAPPAEPLNLALGLRSDESAASAAPTEEVKEKSEVETPEIPEAPLAPEPEVVVEKKKEVIEEPEEKEEQEDPRPAQEALPQAASAAQEAAAPPPMDAPVADKPKGPKQGISNKVSTAVVTWQKSISLHLNKHKRYPSAARSNKIEGTANVSFTLDRSGKVIRAEVIKPSGSELLDDEALETLNRASPFPTPPSEVTDHTIRFTLPIQFKFKH